MHDEPRTFSHLCWIWYTGLLVELADIAKIAKKKQPEHRYPTQYRTSQERNAIFVNRL
jgi:hypothetical protein